MLEDSTGSIKSIRRALSEIPKMPVQFSDGGARLSWKEFRRKRWAKLKECSPVLESLYNSIAKSHESFSERMLDDVRARHESVCRDVAELRGKLSALGDSEWIENIKVELASYDDMIDDTLQAMNLSNDELTRIIEASNLDSNWKYSDDLCSVLLEDIFKKFSPPTEKELETLEKIDSILRV